MSARQAVSLLLLATGVLLSSACAVNPATGKRQFVLISESREIAIGRENDAQISAQMGLYDDAELQRYVQELGSRMAANSERPDLDWSFKVVDDPVVNAFALPGGYIYISRGILAHMSNEAELASVVGHEIGHVTARHSVSQMSQAQAWQLGLGAAAILAPEETERFGGLAQTGLGLMFLKYGRDDERQADDLGLRYLSRSGYDPRPMVDLFDMLGSVSASAGSERLPGWLSTHPTPENRSGRITGAIAALGQDFGQLPVHQQSFYRRIDGIVFGEDPREGYFDENRFLHPQLRFRIDFPQGWKAMNQRQAVVSLSEGRDAVVQLTLADAASARAALAEFFSDAGLTRSGPAMGSIGGLVTSGGGFEATTSQGAIRGRVGFVEYGGRVYQLLGYAADAGWSSHERPIRACLASFAGLTDPSALDVEPQRLRIVRPERAMSLDAFARAHDATVSVETLALINRIEPSARVEAGRSYKVVTGGRRP